MAKKKSRRARRRRTARAPRRGQTAGLGGLSTAAIQAELRRRARGVTKLARKRDSLLARAAELDAEIASLGGEAGGGPAAPRGGGRRGARGRIGRRAGAPAGRKRAKNDANLEVSLAKVLKGKTMGVTEVSRAVQAAGYKTTSPNFRTIVNQALIRSDLIKKVARGKYTAA